MASEIFNYNNILIELYKAVKMHNFYPKGHPNLDATLGKCYQLLREAISSRHEVKWQMSLKGFSDDKTPILPGNQEIAGLAKKLVFRRIKEITFTPDLTQEDLRKFIDIFKVEPEELKAKGGGEYYLAGRDISGILINEINYGDLKRIKKELEEKREEEKTEKIEREKEQAEAGSAEKSEEKKAPVQEKKEAAEEDTFEGLLERIKTQTDYLRYTDLSVRVREQSNPLFVKSEFDRIFQAMLVFQEHLSPASTLSQEIKETAAERLDSYLESRDILQYLISKVAEKDDPDKGFAQRMLLRTEERGIELLLHAVVEAPEASTRRALFNILLQFGKKLINPISRFITSDRWYVVRQMVSLLGELGEQESTAIMETAYRNPDIRVKKEVLKNLARIQSPKSTEILLGALDEQDTSLMIQAIISLGMLRDPAAIDSLGRIALKWEPFTENQEPRKEAIKALGIIGDKRAVPYLANVISKKTWFNKKENEDARALAANSLGLIGGTEAYGAIEKAFRHSEGDLYNACKRILNGKEKGI